MGRKNKARLVPEQDRRILGGICICQLTVVLSIVSLVYLTVAVYLPSHRAFISGLDPVPFTCKTIYTGLPASSCSWASCGEWCLTKTSGLCPQINVMVRRNGSTLRLEGCRTESRVSCPPANPAALRRINCNVDEACGAISGVFNCSLGHCANMSEIYQCHNATGDGPTIDSDKDNMKLNGFFECHKSRCTKIRRPFSCDRYCPRVTTQGVNVMIMHGDTVHTAWCKRAFATSTDEGEEDDEAKVWEPQDGVLMANCQTVMRSEGGSTEASTSTAGYSTGGTTITGTDCVNGTLIPPDKLPKPSVNFTTLWAAYDASLDNPVDPEGARVPSENFLVINPYIRLYINLEGCVNTLRGECLQFLDTHGRDGRNQTAASRYPCFYRTITPEERIGWRRRPKNNVTTTEESTTLGVTSASPPTSTVRTTPAAPTTPATLASSDGKYAYARFDLAQTQKELVIAAAVPSALFVVSAVALLACTRGVRVGDDAKMRCTLCRTGSGSSPVHEPEEEGAGAGRRGAAGRRQQ
ncbi:uncharacterized protein LOC124165110 [Ischnura elegans]|uniref:uncharacterized protein LOC124165110 n=1 Tax=Ischnura elegans TaxID=197161 RepID=UPI001ED870B6|nr:uncharacterized protein LOC124165110 [Ischnura elegans]